MITGNENEQATLPRRPNWNQIQEKAEHGIKLRSDNPAMYEQWLGAVKKMRLGGDCGQIEPWSPYTLRDTYYAGWADGDFGTLLSQVGETDETWVQNDPDNQE